MASIVAKRPTRFRASAAVILSALVAGSLGFGSASADPTWTVQPSPNVSQPGVEGPIPSGFGIRTGEPYGRSLIALPEGWVEEEFFFSGTAYTQPLLQGNASPYASRILVRRPVDPAAFNGTVVLEWNNVTIPHDHDTGWTAYHETIFEEGFVFVGVAAQRLSVEPAPTTLKGWDPVRYESLSHPGDNWSYDIFQQSAEAVLDPKVLGALRPHVKVRLADGASQSAGRLESYINNWQESVGVFDGFQPQHGGVGTIRTDVAPIIYLNSSAEVGGTHEQADSGLFRLWEIAGPAHTSAYSGDYRDNMLIDAHSNGTAGSYDHEVSAGWGYQYPPGYCNRRNFYVNSWIWGAALVTLDEWVKTGEAPASQPRVVRLDGDREYDEHGNVVGGVRSALVDAPIATYYGGGAAASVGPCGQVGGRLALVGFSETFDAIKLAEMYPTKQAYVDAFNAAVDDMLAAGTVLPSGAADLKRRASTYGRPGDSLPTGI